VKPIKGARENGVEGFFVGAAVGLTGFE